MLEDILGEPHNLSRSPKEDRKKLMATMKNFVDINALVARCCWKDFGGEMEGEAFSGGMQSTERRHGQDEGELCELTI